MDKLKILFLAADPIDQPRLRLWEELRKIHEELDRAKHRDNFSLEPCGAVRTDDMVRAVYAHKPQIVHFSGHGINTGELCFENDFGEVQPVEPDALANWFELVAEHVSCVVLNACYSKIQAEAISKHIPIVIEMNKPVDDPAAITFAASFYMALGSGCSFEKAFKTAQVAMQLKGSQEYSTPVLYVKDDKSTPVPPDQPTSPPQTRAVEENSLKSDQGVDYSKLRDFLRAGNWREADYLTYLVMLQAVGRERGDWIRSEEMHKFPCSELRIIDKLWVSYSDGKFGFSAQNRIWCSIQNQSNFFRNPFSMSGKEFALSVGWLNGQGSFKERDDLNFSLDAPKGHLPCTLHTSGRLRREVGYWLFYPITSRLTDCAVE